MTRPLTRIIHELSIASVHELSGLAALALAGLIVGTAPAEGAPSNVTVDRASSQVVGTRQIFSSTQLAVSWTPTSGDRAHHYEVVATESVQGTSVTATAGASATSVMLTTLKAATSYSIVVTTCRDESCRDSSAALAVSGSTDTEYWQMQGAGHSVDRLTKAVSDGNARLSATAFGADAGAMAGRVQLYYGPMPVGRGSSQLAVAVASSAATAVAPDSYLTFTSRSGASGVISPPTPTTWIAGINTGEGVPIARSAGGFVRLFFEAGGADGKTRIVSIDSKDGFFGLDFNAGASGVCSTAADYSAGGGCAPTVVIGVATDAGGPSRVDNARQFKLGWPTLDSPHWDMSPGTFMVFTTNQLAASGCTAQNGIGYAVWDGGAWRVQYKADGCLKLFTSAQAPFPFHSGGVRYRLYYGNTANQTGKLNSPFPFLGPKVLIYGDGRATSAVETVEFEDWESQASARDVVFLWPDGAQLDDTAEGYIDDFHFLAPTGSLDLQVMYITITDGAIAPISVTAVLKNP